MSNSTLMLSDITIKEWRSISHAKIDFSINGEPRKKTIFLGENGAGKTSILRAIALSTVPVIEATALIAEMSGIQRRKNKKGVTSPESCIIAKFVDRSGKEEFSVTTKIVLGSDGKEMVIRETIPSDFPWDRVFSAGYGVGRGVRGAAEISEYDRRTSVLSLFKDNAPLFDAESVLKAIALESKFNETTKRPQFPSLNYFKKIIRNIFCLSPAHRIDVAGKGVYVHGPWGSQPFHALGDGYRSAAGWVLDFLARAWSLDGNTRKEPSGIVLVDEVDEHLHPSWARKIISILIRNFPEVQFIFTTHSPVPIVNSMPNELVVISQHNTITEIHQNLPSTSAKTIDTILRGRWFGLTGTMDDVTENLVSDYRHAIENGDNQGIEKARTALYKSAPTLSPTGLEEVAMKAVNIIKQDEEVVHIGKDVVAFNNALTQKIKNKTNEIKND
ncbi:AAA family ATPase [Aeromonas veronii]|uniref:AAA family ATPase n=2 Tax=Aeromonas TaxID=642 RepID=UPI00226D31CD|nr:AAA family ATPase [Aeromonas veronii]MCX9105956.1 AAA family ATPase [Aeromonas veronii]MCX9121753.1 AAA family ATPase [Aeromonas veronii]